MEDYQWILFGTIFVITAIIVIGVYRERKWGKDLAAWANSHGWSFLKKDPEFAKTVSIPTPTLNTWRPHIFNILRGPYLNYDVIGFDIRYKSSVGDARSTNYANVISVALPMNTPELSVTPQYFFSKVAGILGGGKPSILLGHPEFDKKWQISCSYEIFVRDVFSPQFVDRMLADDVYAREVFFTNGQLVVITKCRQSADQVESRVMTACSLVSLIPPQVWEKLRG